MVLLPVETPLRDRLEDLVKRKLEYIRENQEKLVEAWVAETGLLPSESVMVQQEFGYGFHETRISITRKTDQTLENERLARQRQEDMSARQLALYSPERWSEIQRTLATLKELLNASA